MFGNGTLRLEIARWRRHSLRRPIDSSHAQPVEAAAKMEATFDAFAGMYEQFGISTVRWDAEMKALALCSSEEQREQYMCGLLCGLFLKNGTKVLITDLQSRPELNSQSAVIIGEYRDGRLPVHIHDERMRIRLCNLRPAGFSRRRTDLSGHSIRAVADDDGSTAFMYTVGVCALGDSVIYPMLEAYGRELFVRDVPKAKAEAVAKLMNYLVSRMQDGHAVEDEQLCQSHGLLMVSKLHTEASAEALRDEFDLELPVTSGLIELYPGVVSDDPEVWGGVPTKADRQMMADAPALASAQEAPFLGGVY